MAERRKAKLTILSGRPAMEDAFLALRAAQYHLCNVEQRLRAGLSTDEQVSFFHFHLRGFFWEMTAARDSIRRDAKKDERIRGELDALDESDWFSEVSLYRNFAHQSFHIVEAVKKDGKVLWFQMQLRDGDGMAHLYDYFNRMEATVKTIYPDRSSIP